MAHESFTVTDHDTPTRHPLANLAPELSHVVAKVTTDTDVDYLEVTGLDILSHEAYEIIFDTVNPTASVSEYYLFINGDTTPTNYYETYFQITPTTTYQGSVNTPVIGAAPGGNRMSARITLIRDRVFYIPRYWSFVNRDSGTNIYIELRAGHGPGTVENITSIRIQSEVAGAVGGGSKLVVKAWRRA